MGTLGRRPVHSRHLPTLPTESGCSLRVYSTAECLRDLCATRSSEPRWSAPCKAASFDHCRALCAQLVGSGQAGIPSINRGRHTAFNTDWCEPQIADVWKVFAPLVACTRGQTLAGKSRTSAPFVEDRMSWTIILGGWDVRWEKMASCSHKKRLEKRSMASRKVR